MKLDRLDHFVLTVRDLEATCDFYVRVLGMEKVVRENGRIALHFGRHNRQKINLHQAGREFMPNALNPTPGSADFCLITDLPMQQIVEHLQSCGVAVEEGPGPRTGAAGPIRSVYIRDPDNNLVEIAHYLA
ncbi:MAG: VOC family protein [Ardenticatenaceae bacterium]|nr:VOC family protein [Ardenticatenaceae bacterium]